MSTLRILIVILALGFQVHLPPVYADQGEAQGPRSSGTGVAIERTPPVAGKPGLEPFQLEGERVVLHVAMEATDVGGATSEIGSAGDSTAPDGAAAVGIGASAGLCAGYTGPLDRSQERSRWIAHDWEVTARFTDVRTDRFTFDLDWVRWDRDDRGRPVKGRGDTRRITLKEHQEHVLDFIEVTSTDEQHCNTNIVVRLSVSIAEDPVLADTELLYDLWFVEREGDAVVETSKVTLLAGQGEETETEDIEFRHDLGRPDAGAPFVVAKLGANVIGRARRDGSIDLSVGGHRWFQVGYPTYDPRGGIGAGGRLYVNVRPGEVVELTMPPSLHASSLNYRDPETYVRTRDLPQEGKVLLEDPDWDGTLVTDDSAYVHHGRFFEDRRFSLMISTRTQPR